MSKLAYTLLLLLGVFSQCSPNEVIAKEPLIPRQYPPSAPISTGSTPFTCGTCTYVVPEGKHINDGKALGLGPGDVICLSAAIKYTNLLFTNLEGTKEKPIIITNCGGQVHIELDPSQSFIIKTTKSKHFRITGTGDSTQTYGIKLSGAHLGLTLDYLSTDFEVDHLEVANIGFAGIMAKTDPSCDDATIRKNFTMENVVFHHNYVHDTGGEGLYIGNSFYAKGVDTECGNRLPHGINGVDVFENIVTRSGWESIQVGCATDGARIYNNRIDSYGTKNKINQQSGIQIGEGTGGICYNNIVNKGTGNGITVLGYGDNVIFNNLVINPGMMGAFADERYTKGPGFKFINNTIINPGTDGIRLYSDEVNMNVVVNNLIVNPGSWEAMENKFGRSGEEDAFIYKLNRSVNVDLRNNYFTRNIADVKFAMKDSMDYSLLPGSPALNTGVDVSDVHVTFDLLNRKRPAGGKFDIGAFED